MIASDRVWFFLYFWLAFAFSYLTADSSVPWFTLFLAVASGMMAAYYAYKILIKQERNE